MPIQHRATQGSHSLHGHSLLGLGPELCKTLRVRILNAILQTLNPTKVHKTKKTLLDSPKAHKTLVQHISQPINKR